MGRILAIDPGEATGWAIIDDGVLFACGLAKVGRFEERLDLGDSLPVVGPVDSRLVIEVPETYTSGPLKGHDNSQLTIRVGRIREHYKFLPATQYLPKQWKGQVPKETHNRMVRAALNISETTTYLGCVRQIAEGLRNNVLDAIGLGKYHARRMAAR
jgi:hypothetical protein